MCRIYTIIDTNLPGSVRISMLQIMGLKENNVTIFDRFFISGISCLCLPAENNSLHVQQ